MDGTSGTRERCPPAACSWVGIDGDGSNTVEQLGTTSEIVNGATVYYAWAEAFPAPEVVLHDANGNPAPVEPGDHMSGSIRARGDVYTLALFDYTENWKYQQTVAIPAGQNASAEVITEAPSSAEGILPSCRSPISAARRSPTSTSRDTLTRSRWSTRVAGRRRQSAVTATALPSTSSTATKLVI